MSAEVAIYVFSLFMLFVIATALWTSGELRTPRGRLFFRVIVTAALLLSTSSILMYFQNVPDSALHWLVPSAAVAYYSILPFSGMVLAAYAGHYAGRVSSRTKRAMAIMVATATINTILSLSSLFTGWYFVIEDGYRYSRGMLYPFIAIFTMIPLVLRLAQIVLLRDRINRKLFRTLVAYIVIPSVAGCSEVLIPELKIVWSAYMLAILVMYIHIQSDAIGVDYLTGLGNRREFDHVLATIAAKSRERETYGIFLFEVEEKEQRNNASGQGVGDELLVQFAGMLRSVFPTARTIARIGGSLFAVATEAEDEESCRALAGIVQKVVAAYNSGASRLSTLSVDTGWGIHDPSGAVAAADFLLDLDRRMYMQKRLREGFA